MFGVYNVPFHLERDNISLEVENRGDTVFYRRSQPGSLEKYLLVSKCRLQLSPVEPLHLPKIMTHNLMIEFNRPLLVESREKRKIFLNVPLEIAVYLLSAKKETLPELADVFTLGTPKFTLYGNITNGILCKHYQSDIFAQLPSDAPTPDRAWLQLTVHNSSPHWIQVTRTILSAYAMKLYYDKEFVAMNMEMNLIDPSHAETYAVDLPLRKGMQKAQEYFSSGRMQIGSHKFSMEWGL